MVLLFQPFSPVLVLFSWIVVMRPLHWVALECLWNSWCTTEKCRLESVLVCKGDWNPPTSIVPVTVLVNVCHNDLIPMEREINCWFWSFFAAVCFLKKKKKKSVGLKQMIILLTLFRNVAVYHVQQGVKPLTLTRRSAISWHICESQECCEQNPLLLLLLSNAVDERSENTGPCSCCITPHPPMTAGRWRASLFVLGFMVLCFCCFHILSPFKQEVSVGFYSTEAPIVKTKDKELLSLVGGHKCLKGTTESKNTLYCFIVLQYKFWIAEVQSKWRYLKLLN